MYFGDYEGLYRGGDAHFYIAVISRIGLNALISWALGSQMGLMGIGLASFAGTAHMEKLGNDKRRLITMSCTEALS